MKRCPYCSERNKSSATVCRYCGQYLAPLQTGSAAGQALPSPVGQITGSSPWAVAAVLSGIITALTFLAAFLARPYLPFSYEQVFVLLVPYFLVWWLFLGVLISVLRRLRLSVGKLATQIVWVVLAVIYILFEQLPDLFKGKDTTQEPAARPAATVSFAKATATARVPATPDPNLQWPEATEAGITRRCTLITAIRSSQNGADICIYSHATAGALGGMLASGEGPSVLVAYPIAAGSTTFAGIKVPRRYFEEVFLPTVIERQPGSKPVCFYSSIDQLDFVLDPRSIDGRTIWTSLLYISGEIRLCPEGMP